MARGVPAREIDGGYAFDGWWSYDERAREPAHRVRPGDPWWVRALTPGVDDRYLLALSPQLHADPDDTRRPWTPALPDPGPRSIVRNYGYAAWWPPGVRRLYVLERRGE